MSADVESNVENPKKKKTNPGWCTVRNVKGRQLVFMPDGTCIPGMTLTKVTDPLYGPATAFIKLFVNIDE